MATQYKPILFSTEMVQAILEGRKTQTRRIIKPQPIFYGRNDERIAVEFRKNIFEFYDVMRNDPFSILFSLKLKFELGDILWVRESFEYSDELDEPFWYKQKYKEDYTQEAFERIKWKPSIHMPKEAARIFLEVTNVRVERLKDISEEDAIAEGIDKKGDLYFNYFESKLLGKVLQKEYFYKEIPKVSFMSLWSKINGIDSWKANPWVWVYEFKQVHHPKDFLNED